MVNYRRKAISPVVATALLLVTAVVGVIGFQTWFGTFSSGVLAGVEEKSSTGTGLEIENLIGGSLYVNNKGTSPIANVSVKIGGVICNLSQNFSVGMNTIDVSQCLVNVTESKPEVVLVSPTAVLSKTYLYTPSSSSSVSSAIGSIEWFRNISGNLDIYVSKVLTYGSSVFLLGYTDASSLNFGNNISYNVTGSSCFVSRYSLSGLANLVKNISGHCLTKSMAVDSSGNFYVTGYFDSASLFFGPGVFVNLSNNYDIFLVKYDSVGNALWARSINGSGTEQVYSTITDSSGNVFVSGYYDGNLVFNSTYSFPSAGGQQQMFIAKYSGDSSFLWARNATGGISYGHRVVVDSLGNSYVFGSSNGNLNFGSGIQYSLYNRTDLFLVKYNSSGIPLWVKNISGSADENVGGMVVDSTDNLYLSGYYGANVGGAGNLFFENVSVANSSGTIDNFIFKVSSNGSLIWAKNLSIASDNLGSDIALDSGSNIYFVGHSSSGVNLNFENGVSLLNSGNENFFLLKLNSLGLPIWVKGANGTGDEYTGFLATDSLNNVYLAGTSRNSNPLNFGENFSYVSNSKYSIYFLKYK